MRLLYDRSFWYWAAPAAIISFLWNVVPVFLGRKQLVRYYASDTPLILKGWIVVGLIALSIIEGFTHGWRALLWWIAIWIAATFIGHIIFLITKPIILGRLSLEDLEAVSRARGMK